MEGLPPAGQCQFGRLARLGLVTLLYIVLIDKQTNTYTHMYVCAWARKGECLQKYQIGIDEVYVYKIYLLIASPQSCNINKIGSN
jgi:hypothetical protein